MHPRIIKEKNSHEKHVPQARLFIKQSAPQARLIEQSAPQAGFFV